MKTIREFFVFFYIFIISFIFIDNANAEDVVRIYQSLLPTQNEIKQQMKSVADYQLAQTWPEKFLKSHPLGFGDRSWRAGSYYLGIYEAYTVLKDKSYLDRLVKVGNNNKWRGGPRYKNADDQAVFQLYLMLYEEFKDKKMISSVDSVLNAVVSNTDDTELPWSWSDALFMAPPIFSHYAKITGENKYWVFLDRQWWRTYEELYDKNYNLFYRDKCFKTMKNKNGKPIFWGRGNGWVIAGLCRILQYMPEKYPGRKDYEKAYKEFCRGLLATQHSDGYWKSDMLSPYINIAGETSGTAFICYGFSWGINNGLLDKETYLPAVVKAWNALCSGIHPNGKLGFVQPGGDRPYPTNYDLTEFYGVGGFLMAGKEILSLAPKKHKEVTDVPVKETFRTIEKQMSLMLAKVTDKSKTPRTIRKDGSLVQVPIEDWTSGFFAGTLWYIYEYTGDGKWRKAAEEWNKPLEPLRHFRMHHDVGFMVNCSFGNGYRLTDNKEYRQILIDAADALCTRFNPNVGLIQSWEAHSFRGSEYPVIIDNMMNLELLFNAYKLTGNRKYYDVAVSHADLTMKNHFRDNCSSYHVVDYALNGDVRRKCTAQGYSDASAWSRGQAWGLYGYTFCYRETGDEKYLNHARNIARFMLGHKNMPEDYIPYWDFDAPNIPNEPRDVSAAAIMASGLLELAKFVDREEQVSYYQAARKVLINLCSHKYLALVGGNGNFIQTQSCGSVLAQSEVSVPLNYADYYFVEALLRYMNWK